MFKRSQKQHLEVNLLPRDPFSQSSVGQLLTWTLSIGRYIVVFTEMIVILTFLSRFTLDRQLTDLNESILKKQALLDSYATIESKVRLVQKKAEYLQQLETSSQLTYLLDFVETQTPQDIIFDEINLRSDRFTMIAKAYSPSSLESFINTMKLQPEFSDVLIDKINTSEKDTGINFIVRANFTTPEPSTNSPKTP